MDGANGSGAVDDGATLALWVFGCGVLDDDFQPEDEMSCNQRVLILIYCMLCISWFQFGMWIVPEMTRYSLVFLNSFFNVLMLQVQVDLIISGWVSVSLLLNLVKTCPICHISSYITTRFDGGHKGIFKYW